MVQLTGRKDFAVRVGEKYGVVVGEDDYEIADDPQFYDLKTAVDMRIALHDDGKDTELLELASCKLYLAFWSDAGIPFFFQKQDDGTWGTSLTMTDAIMNAAEYQEFVDSGAWEAEAGKHDERTVQQLQPSGKWETVAIGSMFLENV